MNYIKNEEMTYLDILFAPSFQCGVNGTSLELSHYNNVSLKTIYCRINIWNYFQEL